MRIEDKFREGLKKLLKTTPLDEINVVMLSSSIKSNRQTFYYHYRDLSDVIESIFLKERVGYGIKPLDFESVFKPMFAYINANFSFLYSIANSFASEKLEQFFYSYINQKSNLYIKNTKKTEQIGTNQILYVVRQLSTLLSNELSYWVISKRKERQFHIMKRFNLIWNYFMNTYPEQMRLTK